MWRLIYTSVYLVRLKIEQCIHHVHCLRNTVIDFVVIFQTL